MGLDKNSEPDSPVMFFNMGFWASSEAPGMVLFRPYIYDPLTGMGPATAPDLSPLGIYPNPASDQIWFQIPSNSVGEDIPVYIYDSSGRQLHQTMLRSNSLDVSAFAPGLYYIRVLIAGEPYYSKVLINR